MNQVVEETLGLIREGTKAMGKVGVEFWPELVNYNIAVVLAALGVSLFILGIGLLILWLSIRDAKKKGIKFWATFEMKRHDMFVLVGAAVSGIGCVAVVNNAYWAIVALYAPEAYTVMRILGK